MIPGDRLWAAYRHSWAMEVSSMMTRRVITAGPDTPLLEVARMMVDQDINRVPIVENRRLIGIITRNDILRALASAPLGERPAEAWHPPQGLEKSSRSERRTSDDDTARSVPERRREDASEAVENERRMPDNVVSAVPFAPDMNLSSGRAVIREKAFGTPPGEA